MIVADLCFIVFALNEDSIEFVSDNGYIFEDTGLAEQVFVGLAEYSIGFILFDFVEIDIGEGAINLNSCIILADSISTDFWLTSQSYLDSYQIFCYAIVDDLQFELFPYQMHTNGVVLDITFDDL